MFLHRSTFSGDVGQWLPNGTLRIIDRKKHIFKLSQGEYIVPEKIETIYIKSQFVEQVFVHGESLKVNYNFLVIQIVTETNFLPRSELCCCDCSARCWSNKALGYRKQHSRHINCLMQ